MAWVLATCPDGSIRNGTVAVELAQRADRLSGGGDPVILDSLAAAYAETGRYPDAVQAARRALALASQQKNRLLMEAIAHRIDLYEAGKPFRETGEARLVRNAARWQGRQRQGQTER